MDPDGTTIPAWRRLGLKLQAADQSGAAVSDLNGLKGDGDQPSLVSNGHQEGSVDVHHAIVSTNKGKSPRLGKRKPQLDGPAEDHGQASKKRKKIQSGDQSNGYAANDILNSSKEENAKSTVSTITPDSLPGLSKGDPNYRKKKGRRISSHIHDEAHAGDSQHPAASTSVIRKHEGRRQAIDLSPSPDDIHMSNGETTIASTETDFAHEPPVTTPRPSKKKTIPESNKDFKSSLLSSSPPRTDRRKSVTFTPDTKTTDGNSATNLFKKWVADQKGMDDQFTEAEAAQFSTPLSIHPANGLPVAKVKKESKKAGSANEQKEEAGDSEPPSKAPKESKPRGKKDFSRYTSYLSQYHNDRQNWKFNKAKQNDLLENCLNVFRIPDEYSEALIAYIEGLQGAGLIERLKQKCETTIKELDEEERKAGNTMDDLEDRRIAKAEAKEARIQKEKKRRSTEADIEALVDHPNPDGYIRRLKKRRAENLLHALGMAVPAAAPSASTKSTGDPTKAKDSTLVTANPQRNSRKRKSRTEVSSDESSSDSSSSESSSSEESSSDESGDESEDEDDSSASGSPGSSDGGSSDSDSDSDSDSATSSKDSGGDSDDDSGSSGSSSDSD